LGFPLQMAAVNLAVEL